jgi:hypothetical protein
VINWMLEVEDVEDVACTVVDDMEATGCSGSLVQRGWSEGRGGQEYKGRNDGGTPFSVYDGATCENPPRG